MDDTHGHFFKHPENVFDQIRVVFCECNARTQIYKLNILSNTDITNKKKYQLVFARAFVCFWYGNLKHPPRYYLKCWTRKKKNKINWIDRKKAGAAHKIINDSKMCKTSPQIVWAKCVCILFGCFSFFLLPINFYSFKMKFDMNVVSIINFFFAVLLILLLLWQIQF